MIYFICITWIVKELSLTFHGITYCHILIFLLYRAFTDSQTVNCKSWAIKGSVKLKSRKQCNLTVEMLFGKLLILYT